MTNTAHKNHTRPATPKQIDLILKIVDEIKERDPSAPDLPHETIRAYTTQEASGVIDALLKSLKYLRKTTKAPASTLEEGLYRSTDGTVYQVRRSRTSGHLYALKVTEGATEYAGSAPLAGLASHMLLSSEEAVEIARAYGQSTGICYVCGRRLTTAQSIEQGIGPVCRSRM